MDMPEIEREEVLAQRQEELQRFADKRQLDQMLKLRSGAGAGEESVSKAAKRMFCSRLRIRKLFMARKANTRFAEPPRRRHGSWTS